ncbi:MAG: hypothetical protein KDC66_21725 [Phaeodactylibacter sp.]|nr:hypothetical protein [Phaeodactylibacter sp.]MCB9272917.1 hypothetical protein [Lewinellaceae bacterium]
MPYQLKAYDNNGEMGSLSSGPLIVAHFTSGGHYDDLFRNAKEAFNNALAEDDTKRITNWDSSPDGNGIVQTATSSGTGSTTTYNELISWASYYSDEFRFRILDQNGAPVLSEDGEEIFDNFIRFAFVDFSYILESSAPTDLLQSKPFSFSNTDSDKRFKRVQPNRPYLYLMQPEPADYYYAFDTAKGAFIKNDAQKNRLYLYFLSDDNNISVLEVRMRTDYSQESRGGGGQMRADPVSEVDYVWGGNLAVGLAIGLEHDYFSVLPTRSSFEEECRKKGYEVSPLPRNIFKLDQANNTESIVWYGKKLKTGLNPKRNKPRSNPAPSQYNIVLPNKQFFKIAGQPTDQEIQHYLFTVKREKPISRPMRKREDAGAVMGRSLNSDSNFSTAYQAWATEQNARPGNNPRVDPNKISATQFTQFVLGRLNDFQSGAWQSHKKLNWTHLDALSQDQLALRTDQEWCHLIGHGDGGTEDWGNFIAGSKHCNTIQLAIETAQRQKDYKNHTLNLKVTAYLFENVQFTDDGLTEGDVEDSINVYVLNLGSGSTRKKSSNTTPIDSPTKLGRLLLENNALDNNIRRELINQFLFIMPLARYVRYRIFHNKKRVFDFVFDAQSESFDYNEFRILETTVDRVISHATNNSLGLYKKKIMEKLAKKGVDEASITTLMQDYDIAKSVQPITFTPGQSSTTARSRERLKKGK